MNPSTPTSRPAHEAEDIELLPADSVSPALETYYADRPLLYRNVALITFLSVGWTACFTFINPLLQLGLKGAGLTDSQMGLQGSINAWLYAYFVMYFAWKSDNTVTRFGRRIPYLFISSPVIILTLILFPYFHQKWLLFAICCVQALFMDIKAATIPLLNIDCVPRQLLGRVGAVSGLVCAVVAFFAMRDGMALADWYYFAPFFLGAGLLVCTTLSSLWIKEPPVEIKGTQGFFKPWSTAIVVWKDDPLSFVLFAGVGMLQTFTVMTWCWLTLLASRDLHMTRTEIGANSSWGIVVSFVAALPAGWLIDRYRGMRLIYVYGAVMLLTAWYAVYHMKNAQDFLVVSILATIFGMFYNAADIKVYRETDPKHIGSFTSTNSCLRGFLVGGMTLVSGFLIQNTGDHYEIAFVFGAAMSLIGVLLIGIHDYFKKRRPRTGMERNPILLPGLMTQAQEKGTA